MRAVVTLEGLLTTAASLTDRNQRDLFLSDSKSYVCEMCDFARPSDSFGNDKNSMAVPVYITCKKSR
jgi:hypothetical protein